MRPCGGQYGQQCNHSLHASLPVVAQSAHDDSRRQATPPPSPSRGVGAYGIGKGGRPEVVQARIPRARMASSPMPLPKSRCPVSINLNSISPNSDVNILERRAFASNLRLLIFEAVLSIIIRANSKRHSLRQSSEAVGVVPFQAGQGVLSHETTSQARRCVSSRRWTSARRVFRRRIR